MLPEYIKKQIEEYKEVPSPEIVLQLASQKDAKPRTIISRYSKIKSYIAKKYDLPTSQLDKYKPPKDILDHVVELDEKVRSSRKNFIITNDILEKIKKHANDGFNGKLMYALYCSGRRINEILDSKFKITRVAGKSNKVWFSSLSKQSKPNKEKVTLICDRDSFIDTVKKIRSLRGDTTISKLTSSLNYYLSRNIRGDVTSHNLRGIYAMVLWYKSGRKQNLNGFIQDILHHEEAETALNYAKYIFADDVEI